MTEIYASSLIIFLPKPSKKKVTTYATCFCRCPKKY